MKCIFLTSMTTTPFYPLALYRSDVVDCCCSSRHADPPRCCPHRCGPGAIACDVWCALCSCPVSPCPCDVMTCWTMICHSCHDVVRATRNDDDGVCRPLSDDGGEDDRGRRLCVMTVEAKAEIVIRNVYYYV